MSLNSISRVTNRVTNWISGHIIIVSMFIFFSLIDAPIIWLRCYLSSYDRVPTIHNTVDILTIGIIAFLIIEGIIMLFAVMTE